MLSLTTKILLQITSPPLLKIGLMKNPMTNYTWQQKGTMRGQRGYLKRWEMKLTTHNNIRKSFKCRLRI